VTFYRPNILWTNSWGIAAGIGDPRDYSVNVPALSATWPTLITACTAVTVSGYAVQGAGRGTYYATVGDTQLSSAMLSDTNFPPMPGSPERAANTGMIGDAEDVLPGTPLAPYLAGGLHYDFSFGITQFPDDMPVPASLVLTIVVLDGAAITAPEPVYAAVGDASNYNYFSDSGTSTGSVDIWLDADYANQVHAMCCWGATATGLPAGNWWPAGEGSQAAAHGLVSVYQVVAVTANDPTSPTAISSPITYTLNTSERWAIMAFQSDLIPAEYVPPVAVPARLATIVG